MKAIHALLVYCDGLLFYLATLTQSVVNFYSEMCCARLLKGRAHVLRSLMKFAFNCVNKTLETCMVEELGYDTDTTKLHNIAFDEPKLSTFQVVLVHVVQ